MVDQPPRQEAREVEVAGADTNIRKREYNTNAAEGAIPSGAEMLAQAQELARLGFCVFPVAPGQKRPTITGRLGLATSDPDEIRHLWTTEMWDAALKEKYPPKASGADIERIERERSERIRQVRAAPPGEPRPFNIGISTAKPLANGDRFFAVDFDVKGGEGYAAASASERRRQLIAKIGELPRTPVALTASQGAHAFYKLPEGVEIKSKIGVLPGVDIRGNNDGYVVGPGSIVGGRPYRWSEGRSMADRPLAEAPPALLDLCKASAEGTRAERAVDEKGNVLIEGEADTDTAIALAIEYLKDAEPDAGPGHRHDPLIRIGHRLGDMGLSAAMAADLTEEHWPEAPSVAENIADQFESLWRSRRTPIGSLAVENAFEVVEMPEGEKPRNDNAASEPSAEADGPAILSAAQCLEEELSAEETPLVEELLDLGMVSAWYGKSNVGKSFILAALAYAVATGTPFAGREVRQGAVAYFAYEGARRFRRRLGALLRRDGRKDGFPLYLCAPPKQSIHSLDARKFMRRAIAKIERQSGQKVVLVIVDTLAAARAGSGKAENNSDDMTEVADIFRALADGTGAHVAVVHHTGKDLAKGMRGAYALECAFDSVMEIDGEGTSGEGVIRNPKQRDYDRAKDLAFTLENAVVPIKGGEATTRVAVVMANAGRVQVLSEDENWTLACFDDAATPNSRGVTVVSTAEWDGRMLAVATDECAKGERKEIPSASTRLRLRKALANKRQVESVRRGEWRRAA